MSCWPAAWASGPAPKPRRPSELTEPCSAAAAGAEHRRRPGARPRPCLPLAELARELADAAGRLDALDAGDPAASVRAVFSWSCQQLTDPAARLFRLLGLHPGPDVTVPAAASLAGLDRRGRRGAGPSWRTRT